MDKRIFAKRLKESRQKAGLTQEQLGEKIKTTAATISAYESISEQKGKNPSLENAQNLAIELGVSLDWLCGLNSVQTENTSSVSGRQFLIELVTINNRLGKFEDYATIRFVKSENPYSVGDCLTNIQIKNDTILEFAQAYEKLQDLYLSKALDEELFSTCVNGLLDKYGNELDIK